MFVPVFGLISWALIGQRKSESVQVFQRIFAEKYAGSLTVCVGSNKSESKVVFYLSAFVTLSYERGKIHHQCDKKYAF